MNRTQIIIALEKKGYQAKEHDVVKNGVVFKGITLNTGNRINPVIYPDRIIDDTDTADEAADKVIAMSEAYKNKSISADILTDRDWIMEHLSIALQRTSDEDLVKKPTDLEGIEQYLIIIYTGSEESYSINVTPALLSTAGIPESEAWTIAMIHLVAATEITGLQHMLTCMLYQTFGDGTDDPFHIHVITTSHRTKGASAILCRVELKAFAEKYGTDRLLVLPSSIHEMLILPYDGTQDIDEFSAMVKEINASQVSPEERLTDQAYIITV